eukprot:m.188209 g.188209  ORF g.188209 m.188209 type:complete len:59 (+) comp24816_c0_seq1:335-511(+)
MRVQVVSGRTVMLSTRHDTTRLQHKIGIRTAHLRCGQRIGPMDWSPVPALATLTPVHT